MPIDYSEARRKLDLTFEIAEAELLQNRPCPALPVAVAAHCDCLFRVRTQAFREALLGCVAARMQDLTINVAHPYVGHSPDAYNGRTLDESAINPFLQDQRIPCSRGPFLSVFRRSVKFTPDTREGVRDKLAYDAFMECVAYVGSLNAVSDLEQMLLSLLYRFALLREDANVPLSRLVRFSLDQYQDLVQRLLNKPSGGRFPLLLVVAAFTAIKQHFQLDWAISYQGINVADGASAAGGDITLFDGDNIVLSAEITERVVDRSRVVSTFNTKIVPNRIEDYLFFVLPEPQADARRQGHQYFAQGHEIAFVNLPDWIQMILSTIGKKGRSAFNTEFLNLLDSADVPKSLKVAWNEAVSQVISATVLPP